MRCSLCGPRFIVLRHGLILTLIGLAIGLGAAFGLNRVVSSMLPRMAGSDPLALAGTERLERREYRC